MKLPVVTIETKNGPVEMNESDFDPKVHKLFKDKAVKKPAAKKAK